MTPFSSGSDRVQPGPPYLSHRIHGLARAHSGLGTGYHTVFHHERCANPQPLVRPISAPEIRCSATRFGGVVSDGITFDLFSEDHENGDGEDDQWLCCSQWISCCEWP